MDSDELDSANASLFWLDETAFDAECLPIESLDFATFSGDVVPRDGIQRPILVGSDAPRPRAPRAPQEQPVHVTHVHQTVIQSTLPVVQVHAGGSLFVITEALFVIRIHVFYSILPVFYPYSTHFPKLTVFYRIHQERTRIHKNTQEYEHVEEGERHILRK